MFEVHVPYILDMTQAFNLLELTYYIFVERKDGRKIIEVRYISLCHRLRPNEMDRYRQ